eukprot:scaffold60498_cov42-Prasinocladus_malaysianus.AAC.1
MRFFPTNHPKQDKPLLSSGEFKPHNVPNSNSRHELSKNVKPSSPWGEPKIFVTYCERVRPCVARSQVFSSLLDYGPGESHA